MQIEEIPQVKTILTAKMNSAGARIEQHFPFSFVTESAGCTCLKPMLPTEAPEHRQTFLMLLKV